MHVLIPETQMNRFQMDHLISIQRRIAARVSLEDRFSTEYVAGVDQAFADERIISGVIVVGQLLEVVDHANCIIKASFPYKPCFLSFREGPAAIKATRKLNHRPTLLFVDGCGINHPRKSGLASFIGVLLDIPTIGITKNVLCGEGEEPKKVGSSTPLLMNEEHVGYLLKSKEGCRPIVIAPGNRISLESSIEMACNYLLNSKLPEPCRLAHQYANRVKRELKI